MAMHGVYYFHWFLVFPIAIPRNITFKDYFCILYSLYSPCRQQFINFIFTYAGPPSAIIGGVVGTIAFLIFCFILTAIVIYVVSLSRKRRSGFQYRTFTVGPVSSAVSLAQTSTNIQATAYPLQHPVNLALYPSGPQQTPATINPLIEGEPGEPKNPELHSNAPSTYPGLNYPSVSLPVAMDVSNNYPGQQCAWGIRQELLLKCIL